MELTKENVTKIEQMINEFHEPEINTWILNIVMNKIRLTLER